MSRFVTAGNISSQTGAPLWQVQYVLRTRNIESIQRVANIRVYDLDVVGRVQEELDSMGKRHAR